VFGEGVENDVDVVIQRAEVLAQEITQLRSIIKDLDDKQAAAMRLLMLREYGKRDDVLRLAMAIRATRLQHAHRLPIFARHQLAVDTLQLWAPLSFHLGTAGYLSELEVHSYVLLFPRSFGAFIDWYGAYRPLAKIAVELFRQDIESLLKSTPGVSESIRKVTIQSRLKTPASAFKKMVKGVKSHHQLLDLAGVRVIVDEAGDVADISMELKAVQLALEVVTAMPNWKEEKARFKDYISSPKPSGYQSFHLSLRHKTQGLTLEVQIRSRRMHNIAEYGSASHKNYKALMLPEKSATADSSIS
jgi:GTP pyrophosphokinase